MVLMIVIDVFLARYYANMILQEQHVGPKVSQALPNLGLFSLDYQNPQITPYRSFLYPSTKYFDIQERLFSSHSLNMHGLFYRHTLTANYLNNESEYLPIHRSFNLMRTDTDIVNYYNQNHDFIFQVPYAIQASVADLRSIVNNRSTREICIVEGKAGLLQQLPKVEQTTLRNDSVQEFRGIISSNQLRQINNMVYLSFKLPQEFPKYLATSILTKDRKSIDFQIETQADNFVKLEPAQGNIIRPWTFDVQNIRTGWLIAALPVDNFPQGLRYVLRYSIGDQTGFGSILRYTTDSLSFHYYAEQSGWLVVQYPFDKKWKVRINNKNVPFYKTNKYFIGFPIKEGKNKISITYWPDSPLRPMLLISLFLSSMSLLVIIWVLMRDEN
jgi:hypothetical protein